MWRSTGIRPEGDSRPVGKEEDEELERHHSAPWPIWLDERGRLRPEAAVPPVRPRTPIITLPPELLRFYGWQPFQVWDAVTAPLRGDPGAG
jgi:hypothetical protein